MRTCDHYCVRTECSDLICDHPIWLVIRFFINQIDRNLIRQRNKTETVGCLNIFPLGQKQGAFPTGHTEQGGDKTVECPDIRIGTIAVAHLLDRFGKSILDALKPKGRKVWEVFLNTLLSIRSEISFDINGNPQWGLGVGAMVPPQTTLDEIFAYLRSADKHCFVAIDEFQQILYYNDNHNVEASLRTQIQQCPNANFVFAGSQRHLMSEMFLSPSRPFYQSVVPMSLGSIPLDRYWAFAEPQFAKNGDRRISYEVVASVYQRFEGITANLQRIMNILYMLTPKGETCTLDMIDRAIDTYLQLSSAYYGELLRQMPEKQRNVFLAIAAEGQVKNISGGKFVHKYHLPSTSSVVSAVKGLLEKDFITQNDNVYSIYDRFFQLWLESARG